MYNLLSLKTGALDFSAIKPVLEIFRALSYFSSVVSIVLFILFGIGLYKISKKLSLKAPAIAFVPILQIFAMGRIAQKYVKQNGKKSAKFGAWLLVMYVVVAVSLLIFIVFGMVFISRVILSLDLAVQNGSTLTANDLALIIPVIISYFFVLAAAVIYEVIYYVALWRTFAVITPKNATLFTVLSIFFSFLAPIFVFALRNSIIDEKYIQQEIEL